MNIVTGVFSTIGQSIAVYNALKDAGVPQNHIGVITRDVEKRVEIGENLGIDYGEDYYTAGEDVVVEPYIVLQDLPGGYVRAAHDGGLDDCTVGWYRDQLTTGNVVVTAAVEDNLIEDARRVMQGSGALATPPCEHREEKTTMTDRERMHDEDVIRQVTMPVTEEGVEVHKVVREVGDVTITPEVTKRRVDIPATIEHQEIRVERRKLDRPVSPDDYKMAGADEDVVRIPVIEEEVRVTKVPVVREELIITRVTREEKRTLHEEVTRTEPHVERHGDVNITGEDRAA